MIYTYPSAKATVLMLLVVSLVACGGGSSNPPITPEASPTGPTAGPTNPFDPVDPNAPAEPVVVTVVLVQSDPAPDSTRVALDATMSVTLSEAIDVASVNETNVVLLEVGEDQISGSISVSSDTVTFSPFISLTPGSEYRLELRQGIRATSGNSIADTQTVGFTTIEGISVTDTSPADGVMSIGIETPLVITFDKVIDPTTVTEDTIEVTPDTFVEGRFRSVLAGSISVDENQLTFVPDGGLWQEYETTYTVRISPIRSIDNEPLITPPSSRFTSAFWDEGYVYNLFVETSNPRNRSLQLFDNDNIFLSDQAPIGNENRWHFTEQSNGSWGIRNLGKSDFEWLEGGDGTGLARLDNAFLDDDLFTGQQWEPVSFNPFADREQFRGESPLNYFLTNRAQGENRVLGVLFDNNTGVRSGRMQPRQGNVNTLWWFKRDTKLLFDF